MAHYHINGSPSLDLVLDQLHPVCTLVTMGKTQVTQNMDRWSHSHWLLCPGERDRNTIWTVRWTLPWIRISRANINTNIALIYQESNPCHPTCYSSPQESETAGKATKKPKNTMRQVPIQLCLRQQTNRHFIVGYEPQMLMNVEMTP
jgi:hypothetical protein